MNQPGAKPTFLVIGAGKAGTTTFWQLLRQHPQIFMSTRKEPHFFSFDKNFARGAAWYEAHFAEGRDHAHRGEASTTYSLRNLFPHAAERIAAYDPTLKLIYLVRDPGERIESAWQQLRRFGPAPGLRAAGMGDVPDAMWVDNSFDRAVRLQSQALVESTNYRKELALYEQHFCREQILVLLFEDLKRDPRAVMGRCFGFLGVDSEVELTDYAAHENVYGHYPVLRPGLRRFWSVARRREVSAALVDRLPQALCERLSRWFLRVPLSGRPRWEPETRSWMLECLGDDLRVFLRAHGYPEDVWDLGDGTTPMRGVAASRAGP